MQSAPAHVVRRHRIIVDDCIQALADIYPGTVDLVVTSPPYNIGLGYNSYDDGVGRPDYLDFLRRTGERIAKVLRDDGSFFLNVAGTASDPWIAMDVAAVMRDSFVLQNNITWIKSISINEDTVGHFKPINSRRFLNRTHESLFHFTKRGDVSLDRLAIGVPFKDKSNINRWGGKVDRRCAGDNWFIPYDTIWSRGQKFNHPSPFPVAVPERCIRLHGKVSATVLDPFLGTGSTLVAAEWTGCTGIGIEIDPVYARSAIARLDEAVAETAADRARDSDDLVG